MALTRRGKWEGCAKCEVRQVFQWDRNSMMLLLVTAANQRDEADPAKCAEVLSSDARAPPLHQHLGRCVISWAGP